MNNGPMIEVENLTKRYGGRAAVQGLNFSVGKGEIAGFLGINGAGKSTTLRILSCYMPATSGTARVAGFDVFSEADEVRRRIGYMPENNPLHLEMRVREYLKFRARLKGLSRARSRERADVVVQQCGLTEVTSKVIGQLSKGYRQRVGLADALIHEPDLLILDEPTNGLDPRQIQAVRQLIKDVGRTRTVLISSHQLYEVEMTCNRVIVINDGRILACDTIDDLHKHITDTGQVIAEIAAPLAELRQAFEEMAEVEHFEIASVEGSYLRGRLIARRGVDIRPKIFELCGRKHWPVRELTRSRHTLEDIFLHLTRTDKEEEN